MSELEKALQALTKAMESNEPLTKVTVTITLTKSKQDKAKDKAKS